MRAGGKVLMAVQAPQTVFGLPIRLGILGVGLAIGIGGAVFNAIGALTGFLTMMGLFATVVVLLWLMRRTDAHCETLLLLPYRVLKGKTGRQLTAGAALQDRGGRQTQHRARWLRRMLRRGLPHRRRAAQEAGA